MFRKLMAVVIAGLAVMAGPAAANNLRSAASNLLGSVNAPALREARGPKEGLGQALRGLAPVPARPALARRARGRSR